jgi:hypothetical protein
LRNATVRSINYSRTPLFMFYLTQFPRIWLILSGFPELGSYRVAPVRFTRAGAYRSLTPDALHLFPLLLLLCLAHPSHISFYPGSIQAPGSSQCSSLWLKLAPSLFRPPLILVMTHPHPPSAWIIVCPSRAKYEQKHRVRAQKHVMDCS